MPRGFRRRFRGGERVDRSRQSVLSIRYASYSYAASAPGLIIPYGEGKVDPGRRARQLVAVFPRRAAMNEAGSRYLGQPAIFVPGAFKRTVHPKGFQPEREDTITLKPRLTLS